MQVRMLRRYGGSSYRLLRDGNLALWQSFVLSISLCRLRGDTGGFVPHAMYNQQSASHKATRHAVARRGEVRKSEKGLEPNR